MGAAGLLLAAGRRVFVRKGKQPPGRVWLALLPPLLGLTFWFFTVPDIRFAGAGFGLLGAIPLSLALAGLLPRRVTPVLVLALAIGLSWSSARQITWVEPDPETGYQSLGEVALEAFDTQGGVTLFVPLKDNRCFDSHLLCTPKPNTRLSLRQAGDLRQGFILLGEP
jgi:hypothetical protein